MDPITDSNRRVRLHLDFTLGAYEKLLDLRSLTKANTEAEVIQQALAFYEASVLNEGEPGPLAPLESSFRMKTDTGGPLSNRANWKTC